jgi:hypothetical protein
MTNWNALRKADEEMFDKVINEIRTKAKTMKHEVPLHEDVEYEKKDFFDDDADEKHELVEMMDIPMELVGLECSLKDYKNFKMTDDFKKH